MTKVIKFYDKHKKTQTLERVRENIKKTIHKKFFFYILYIGSFLLGLGFITIHSGIVIISFCLLYL